jgi:hypothetical protein
MYRTDVVADSFAYVTFSITQEPKKQLKIVETEDATSSLSTVAVIVASSRGPPVMHLIIAPVTSEPMPENVTPMSSPPAKAIP